MSDKAWFIAAGETQRGPFPESQIRIFITAGEITRDTFLWSEGMPAWQMARDIPGLISSSPPPIRPPLTQSQMVPSQEGPPTNSASVVRVSSDTQAMMLFQANQKSMLVSYLLWFFLGWTGAHRFYNSNIGGGVAQLIAFISAIVLYIIGIGLIMVGKWAVAVIATLLWIFCAIWWLIDAFLIPGWVRRQNNNLAAQLSQN
jgi:TM2 domain-containing membrane protein YozV